MKQYLLSIVQPEGPPPPAEVLGPIMRNVGALIQEIKAAGAWVFNGGLEPPSTATVVRLEHRNVLAIDGPFIETKEHIGGIIIIKAPDLDAAMEWGRKAARDHPPHRGAAIPGRGRGLMTAWRAGSIPLPLVDHVQEGEPPRETTNVLFHELHAAAQDLVRHARDVRRDDDVLEGPEGMPRGERLGVGDVEARPGEPALGERLDQGVGDDELPPRDVDDVTALLQERELLRADESFRPGRERRRDEDHIRPGQRIMEPVRLEDLLHRAEVRLVLRVQGQDTHAEGRSALGDLGPDPARHDDKRCSFPGARCSNDMGRHFVLAVRRGAGGPRKREGIAVAWSAISEPLDDFRVGRDDGRVDHFRNKIRVDPTAQGPGASGGSSPRGGHRRRCPDEPFPQTRPTPEDPPSGPGRPRPPAPRGPPRRSRPRPGRSACSPMT